METRDSQKKMILTKYNSCLKHCIFFSSILAPNAEKIGSILQNNYQIFFLINFHKENIPVHIHNALMHTSIDIFVICILEYILYTVHCLLYVTQYITVYSYNTKTKNFSKC